MTATIQGNAIVFTDHVVVCDPAVASEDYLQDMLESLSPSGSISQHRRELYNMNNDGSWRIHRSLSTPFPTK